MYLGRPEGLQLGRKDVAESGIRTEIQTGIHEHARSQNVPMITMQWFVVVCAPPAPAFALRATARHASLSMERESCRAVARRAKADWCRKPWLGKPEAPQD